MSVTVEKKEKKTTFTRGCRTSDDGEPMKKSGQCGILPDQLHALKRRLKFTKRRLATGRVQHHEAFAIEYQLSFFFYSSLVEIGQLAEVYTVSELETK